jgi:uncharacterized protein (UPF0335 family)
MAIVDSDSVAQDQIKAFVDRIMRLREEERAIKGDVREVYAEAKANGFDKTILGKIVNYIEKRETSAGALQESEALFDLYLTAYDAAGTVRATHTHEAELTYLVPAHDPITGEIANETPVSHTPEQPAGDDPDSEDGAASSGETAKNPNMGNSHIQEPEAAMLPQTDHALVVTPPPPNAGLGAVESPAISSQAKASEDNALTAKDRAEVGTEGTGDASRLSAGSGTGAPITEQQGTILAQTEGRKTSVAQSAAPNPQALAGAAVAAGGDSVDPSAVPAVPDNVVPMRKQWKYSDKAHPDCLDPSTCGGFSNLARCQRCREAAAQGQVA